MSKRYMTKEDRQKEIKDFRVEIKINKNLTEYEQYEQVDNIVTSIFRKSNIRLVEERNDKDYWLITEREHKKNISQINIASEQLNIHPDELYQYYIEDINLFIHERCKQDNLIQYELLNDDINISEVNFGYFDDRTNEQVWWEEHRMKVYYKNKMYIVEPSI